MRKSRPARRARRQSRSGTSPPPLAASRMRIGRPSRRASCASGRHRMPALPLQKLTRARPCSAPTCRAGGRSGWSMISGRRRRWDNESIPASLSVPHPYVRRNRIPIGAGWDAGRFFLDRGAAVADDFLTAARRPADPAGACHLDALLAESRPTRSRRTCSGRTCADRTSTAGGRSGRGFGCWQ